jgi:hypothetical protein
MKKFNLNKRANKDSTINEKMLDKNRKDMDLSNDKQDVVGKNINFSLSKKEKDNTIPFNQQLEASRQNKKDFEITEYSMSDKIVDFKSSDKKQVMDINIETKKHSDKQSKAFKKEIDIVEAETEFWDKYVGIQLERPMKNIDNIIPNSASQLQNAEGRIDGDKINKMVMASLKDADSMLFHIYATAFKEERGLTDTEQQQVIDINGGKMRILAENNMIMPFRRSLEYSGGDPIIKQENGVISVYEVDGTKIDEFRSYAEAKANYPEGEIQDV